MANGTLEKCVRQMVDEMIDDFKEVMGYTWALDCDDPDEEGRVYCRVVRMPATCFSDECVFLVTEGYLHEVAAFLEPYIEGLKVGVKAMAGAPERAGRMYTYQYQKDLEVYLKEEKKKREE